MLRKICFLLLMILVINFCLPAYGQTVGSSVGSSDYFVGDAIIESEYRLGPGDQVSANLIVGDNDMSLDYKFILDPEGKIFFPRVGEIKLLGLTIPEAKKLVRSRIRGVYKVKFIFSFRLSVPRKIQIYLSGAENKPHYMGERKFVYVYGQVSNTGRFEYLPGKKYSDYISYAGGPKPNAFLGWSSITRENKKIAVNGYDVIFNGNRSKDSDILPGDVINVPANFFYFSGD